MAFSENGQSRNCRIAQAYKAALDADPRDIHEIHALSAPEVECSFEQSDGTICTVKNLMVFPNPPIAVGYENFCELRVTNQHQFEKSAKGSFVERVQRLGRSMIYGLRGSTDK